MANVQIPNLPAAIALNGSEEIPAVQAGTTVRITAGQLTQFVSSSTAAGGVNDGVQYNFNGVLASNSHFTTDGIGNVAITGSDSNYPSDGTLTITVFGQDDGQATALTLFDNSSGADGVTQIFKTSGFYPDTQVSLNLDSESGLFSITDDMSGANILSYTNTTALTLSNGVIPITLDAYIVAQTTIPVESLTLVQGARAFVTNSANPAVGNFGVEVVAGGSYTVPVWCDGSTWYIG